MPSAGKPPDSDRRRFLRQAAGTALGAATWLLAGCPSRGAAPEPQLNGSHRPRTRPAGPSEPLRAPGTPDVVVARGGSIDDRLAAVLEPLGGITRFVKPNATVLIKPNGAFSEAPDRGSNTTPEVVAAVIRACRAARAAKVVVAEHCLSNHGLFGTRADVSGVSQAAMAEGAEVLDTGADRKHYQDIRLDAPRCATHPVSRLLYEADTVINLPRLKEHPIYAYTMSIKNLMGVMRSPNDFHGRHFPRRISALARALQPRIALSIIDATDRVENWAAGRPGARLTRLDTLIAGTNMVSLDAVGLTFFGASPLDDWRRSRGNNYVRTAHNEGWGNADLRLINRRNVSV